MGSSGKPYPEESGTMAELTCRSIAHIYNDYSGKFGIPRQSGLALVESVIVFDPEFRNADALRGLEDYSHLWLLWQFSENVRTTAQENGGWNPTVRPPKLGGNTRMGVFATRSPFRPNPIGLSSVELVRIDWDTPKGAVLYVRGADLMNGTPIFDIKPYLPYTDAHPEAWHGFALDRGLSCRSAGKISGEQTGWASLRPGAGPKTGLSERSPAGILYALRRFYRLIYRIGKPAYGTGCNRGRIIAQTSCNPQSNAV